MRNCTTFLPLLMSLFFNVKCSPISQPGYESSQFVGAQSVPAGYKPQQIQYKPQAQPARPVYEAKAEGLQYYSSQQPQQKAPPSIQTPGYAPVRQVFVPTHQGPRQIDTNYYDQVVKAQQQTPRSQTPQQIVYQPQHIKYAPQPQAQPQYRYQQQPQAQPQKPEEEEEEPEGDYDPNPSYQFGFDVKDDQFTNYQTRQEERDGKKITGSYSVVDADGYIRTVKYTADPKEGFKAEVSREPTDIKIRIPKPDPQYQYQQPPRHRPQQQQQQQQQQEQRQPVRPQQPQYIQVVSGHRNPPPRAQEEEDQNVLYQYQ